MDATQARGLLEVGPGADASEINDAFRIKVVALDALADPLHRLRLDKLIEAREWLLREIANATPDHAIDLDPSAIIEIPLLVASPEVSGREGDRTPLSDDEPQSPSPLRVFLGRTAIHEHAGAALPDGLELAGAPLPDALIRWAALAATATILWGAVAIPLRPYGHWSQILYVLGDQAAWIAAQSHQAAIGLILLGFVLFAASLRLPAVRQQRGRYLATAHIGVGSAAALPGAAVVLIIALNGFVIVVLGAVSLAFLYWMFMLFVNR
jgi:hypothetical protein